MDNVRNAATRTAIAVVSIIRQVFLRGRLSPIGGFQTLACGGIYRRVREQ
jgi:hypothetical protein